MLNSLGSPASRRVYEYAIDQFTAWYCSEPRLAFNRIVVVRYRMHMESRGLAANTINQQLAAVGINEPQPSIGEVGLDDGRRRDRIDRQQIDADHRAGAALLQHLQPTARRAAESGSSRNITAAPRASGEPAL